jgi:hypothetical protein
MQTVTSYIERSFLTVDDTIDRMQSREIACDVALEVYVLEKILFSGG